jgi:hypothetical protein
MEEWDDVKSNKQGKRNKVKKKVCKQDVGRGTSDESEVWKQEDTRTYRRKIKNKTYTKRRRKREREEENLKRAKVGRLRKEK